jgi:hypothetical protein
MLQHRAPISNRQDVVTHEIHENTLSIREEGHMKQLTQKLKDG